MNSPKLNGYTVTRFGPRSARVNEADNLGVAIHHGQGSGSLSFGVAFIDFNFL